MSDTFEDFAGVEPGTLIVIRTESGTDLAGVISKVDEENRRIEFTHGVGYQFPALEPEQPGVTP